MTTYTIHVAGKSKFNPRDEAVGGEMDYPSTGIDGFAEEGVVDDRSKVKNKASDAGRFQSFGLLPCKRRCHGLW